MEAECLLCVARVLSAWVAALEGDAYAIYTNMVAEDTLIEILGHEPPEGWSIEVPAPPGDLGLLS